MMAMEHTASNQLEKNTQLENIKTMEHTFTEINHFQVLIRIWG